MTAVSLLDDRLAQLRGDAAEQDRVYQSSKQKLYGMLVDTYLWWREARLKDGYLESRLAEANIRDNKKNQNKPNFNPVLKLVLGLRQQVDAVTISNWGSAMNAIDDEYLRNEQVYKNRDTADELISWINDNGGLSGVTGRAHRRTEERGYDYKDAGVKKKTSDKEKAEKRKRAEEIIALKKTAIGQLSIAKTFDIGEVGLGEQNLVLVLAQATGLGSQLKVVGATAKQGLIDGTILETSTLDLADVSPNLRMLCEAVQMNTLTKAQQDYGARDKYYDKTTTKIDGVALTRLQQPRVILRRNGTLMVSRTSAKASLITFHIPHTPNKLDQDYWLRGSDRHWLETDLINDSELVLYNAEPKHGVADQKNKQIKANKKITLKSKDKKHQRNLYFYDFSRVDDNIAYQPNIVDGDPQYDWAVKGKKSYFERIFLQHFDGWQHKVRHRVHTPNNKAIAFDVIEDGIVLEAKWDKEQKVFTQTGNRYLTAFGDDAETCGIGRTIFSPIDMLSVLEVIKGSEIEDDTVMMSGNADLLFVNYRTKIAEIKVFIPACDEKGKRVATYFKKFEAND